MTNEKLGLFGEDYYNDKSVFLYAHRLMVQNLYKKVNATGFPITIIDLKLNKNLTINSKEKFDTWLKDSHPSIVL